MVSKTRHSRRQFAVVECLKVDDWSSGTPYARHAKIRRIGAFATLKKAFWAVSALNFQTTALALLFAGSSSRRLQKL
jgi:hypothetical protein